MAEFCSGTVGGVLRNKLGDELRDFWGDIKRWLLLEVFFNE